MKEVELSKLDKRVKLSDINHGGWCAVDNGTDGMMIIVRLDPHNIHTGYNNDSEVIPVFNISTKEITTMQRDLTVLPVRVEINVKLPFEEYMRKVMKNERPNTSSIQHDESKVF